MCFSARLYIWGFIRSLKLKCTGIQTLIRVLYTQYQGIYRAAALNRSDDIFMFHALQVTSKMGITYLQIRSGGIN
jgi:hypothetical protein